MKLHTYYGACGVEHCLDCRPIFDADNEPIPGTEWQIGTREAVRKIVHRHIERKFDGAVDA